ncbi:MAG: hypothetical protein A3F43_01350 [Gammaproteobacteria bacterium RIFCSPHIGHO2_12_FULL_42_10]|nr:MAG: hypothetical protein A3F43_01350 [Gammaproteobacteria bacterium RIFCSPHIGHO2_12_FULL_42_10]
MELHDERKQSLVAWLATIQTLQYEAIVPMLGDASFRRYFRVVTSQGSFVAMDAPPAKEDCTPFVKIACLLRQHGLHAPHVIASHVEQGFLLMTDYGDLTYLKALQTTNVDQLYGQALQALSRLQHCHQHVETALPRFGAAQMLQEWALHKEWFAEKWLGLSLIDIEKSLDACYLKIVEDALSQPQVLMHRDYHSANLMVIPEAVGILDFQDACIGPVTYDPVSLLRDCYIDWPDARVKAWILQYAHLLKERHVFVSHDFSEPLFLRWFDWMGLQRHLKALMIFSRKAIRDNEPRYLQYIPRVLAYLERISSQYSDFEVLHAYIRQRVIPATKRVMSSCALSS